MESHPQRVFTSKTSQECFAPVALEGLCSIVLLCRVVSMGEWKMRCPQWVGNRYGWESHKLRGGTKPETKNVIKKNAWGGHGRDWARFMHRSGSLGVGRPTLRRWVACRGRSPRGAGAWRGRGSGPAAAPGTVAGGMGLRVTRGWTKVWFLW